MYHDDSSTPALLAESAPRLRAQGAAITLRMWHHLASEEARLLLFEQFRSGDRAYPLIETLSMAASDPGARFVVALPPEQIRAGREGLGIALGNAIADILGEAGGRTIAVAWRGVLDRLLLEIARRAEHRRG